MKKYVYFLMVYLFCSNAFAANYYYRERTIIGAGIYYSGDKSILIIDIDGDKSGMSACASSRRFAISSTAPHYKEMVSIAMTAYASVQNSVDLYVTDTCNHWGNAQDLLGIKMGKMPW
ncbi:hypothetical protein [Shewanella algae]|uniref:hypothetical protein n=1 Tax=Shewanella algae TaxID=38313 RepID=UPI001AAF9A4B|nr:hypothetical protein [Shewanella algae]MBO2587801.1 hypothetical protein [Shewanella algae]